MRRLSVSEKNTGTAGDQVMNVPLQFIGANWIFLLNALGIILVILQEVFRLNVLGYFITDSTILLTVNNWMKGIISLFTIILLATQTKLVTTKIR